MPLKLESFWKEFNLMPLDDVDLVRNFITESEFPVNVKETLIAAIQLERLGRPISEYQNLAALLASGLPDED
jgi:hypothetical protein